MREVWYVSYGSNMCRDRLLCYLQGGQPVGATVCYQGARDTTAPRDDAAVLLPGSLYFAGTSRVWGEGGMAFYDHTVAGPTPARAYRITIQQFADIAAQEMHKLPDPGNPIEQVITGGLSGGRHSAGPGHYETLIEVGARDGIPMYTFTAPGGMHEVPHTQPSDAYLTTIATGLRESHAWDEERTFGYFASLTSAARAASEVLRTAAPSAR